MRAQCRNILMARNLRKCVSGIENSHLIGQIIVSFVLMGRTRTRLENSGWRPLLATARNNKIQILTTIILGNFPFF